MTSYEYFKHLILLTLCMSLLAALLSGSVSTVSAQTDEEPTTCEECRTDAECERLCGGEYGRGIASTNHDPCLRPPKPCVPPKTPLCIEGTGWVCVRFDR